MVTSTEADGSLVLAYDAAPWPSALFSLTSVFVAMAIYDLTIGTRGSDRLPGLIGASLTCGLGAVMVTQSSTVRVNLTARTVEWDRMWAFRRYRGSVRFDEIAAVITEQSMNMSIYEAQHRRIVLRTEDGRLIPFTAGYLSDTAGRMAGLAERVRHLVGLDRPTAAS